MCGQAATAAATATVTAADVAAWSGVMCTEAGKAALREACIGPAIAMAMVDTLGYQTASDLQHITDVSGADD